MLLDGVGRGVPVSREKWMCVKILSQSCGLPSLYWFTFNTVQCPSKGKNVVVEDDRTLRIHDIWFGGNPRIINGDKNYYGF